MPELARIRCWQGFYRIQIGLNPANVICQPTQTRGFYKVSTWPTREQAQAWAEKHNLSIEQEAQ